MKNSRMPVQEIKQKINELSKQRNELDNKLWPKSTLLPEEKDKALLVV
jgi:hypothetical protein